MMKAEARESYLLGKLSTTPPSHISSLHFVLSDVIINGIFKSIFLTAQYQSIKTIVFLGGGQFSSWLEGGASQHFL